MAESLRNLYINDIPLNLFMKYFDSTTVDTTQYEPAMKDAQSVVYKFKIEILDGEVTEESTQTYTVPYSEIFSTDIMLDAAYPGAVDEDGNQTTVINYFPHIGNVISQFEILSYNAFLSWQDLLYSFNGKFPKIENTNSVTYSQKKLKESDPDGEEIMDPIDLLLFSLDSIGVADTSTEDPKEIVFKLVRYSKTDFEHPEDQNNAKVEEIKYIKISEGIQDINDITVTSVDENNETIVANENVFQSSLGSPSAYQFQKYGFFAAAQYGDDIAEDLFQLDEIDLSNETCIEKSVNNDQGVSLIKNSYYRLDNKTGKDWKELKSNFCSYNIEYSFPAFDDARLYSGTNIGASPVLLSEIMAESKVNQGSYPQFEESYSKVELIRKVKNIEGTEIEVILFSTSHSSVKYQEKDTKSGFPELQFLTLFQGIVFDEKEDDKIIELIGPAKIVFWNQVSLPEVNTSGEPLYIDPRGHKVSFPSVPTPFKVHRTAVRKSFFDLIEDNNKYIYKFNEGELGLVKEGNSLHSQMYQEYKNFIEFTKKNIKAAGPAGFLLDDDSFVTAEPSNIGENFDGKMLEKDSEYNVIDASATHNLKKVKMIQDNKDNFRFKQYDDMPIIIGEKVKVEKYFQKFVAGGQKFDITLDGISNLNVTYRASNSPILEVAYRTVRTFEQIVEQFLVGLGPWFRFLFGDDNLRRRIARELRASGVGAEIEEYERIVESSDLEGNSPILEGQVRTFAVSNFETSPYIKIKFDTVVGEEGNEKTISQLAPDSVIEIKQGNNKLILKIGQDSAGNFSIISGLGTGASPIPISKTPKNFSFTLSGEILTEHSGEPDVLAIIDSIEKPTDDNPEYSFLPIRLRRYTPIDIDWKRIESESGTNLGSQTDKSKNDLEKIAKKIKNAAEYLYLSVYNPTTEQGDFKIVVSSSEKNNNYKDNPAYITLDKYESTASEYDIFAKDKNYRVMDSNSIIIQREIIRNKKIPTDKLELAKKILSNFRTERTIENDFPNITDKNYESGKTKFMISSIKDPLESERELVKRLSEKSHFVEKRYFSLKGEQVRDDVYLNAKKAALKNMIGNFLNNSSQDNIRLNSSFTEDGVIQMRLYSEGIYNFLKKDENIADPRRSFYHKRASDFVDSILLEYREDNEILPEGYSGVEEDLIVSDVELNRAGIGSPHSRLLEYEKFSTNIQRESAIRSSLQEKYRYDNYSGHEYVRNNIALSKIEPSRKFTSKMELKDTIQNLLVSAYAQDEDTKYEELRETYDKYILSKLNKLDDKSLPEDKDGNLLYFYQMSDDNTTRKRMLDSRVVSKGEMKQIFLDFINPNNSMRRVSYGRDN